MIKRLLIVLASVALLAAAILGGLWYGARWLTKPSDPVTIAAASLQAVREQNVLVPFAARFVAVVTSTQSRFGFSAKKTLIMPGMVRYEIDLAALQQGDLNWNATTSTLAITLPPVRIAGPEVDLKSIREYGEGGVLMVLTNTEQELDSANRNAGQAELLRQAREPLPMKLARDAARNAIERSFVMPLRAAGIDAKVTARFEGES